MKRERVYKLTACCIVGAMLVAGGNSYSTEASSRVALMPAAGIARAFGEEVSIKTKSKIVVADSQLGDIEEPEDDNDNDNESETSEALEVESATEDDNSSEENKSEEKESEVSEATESDEEKSSTSSTLEALPSAGAGVMESDTASTEAAEDDEDDDEEDEDSDNKKSSKKSSTVSSGSIENISAGAGTAVEVEDDYSGDMNLVDAVTAAENDAEEEEFTDLVIAKVDNYVYVRSEPSEESEYTGKLYNNSVGNKLSVSGDWIKIKSGNTEGYVKSSYVVTGDEAKELAKEVGSRNAKVLTTTLYVRSDASKDAEVIGMVPMDDVLSVIDEDSEGWAKVSVEEGEGYVSDEFIKIYTDFVHAESKAEEEARLEKEEREREEARKAAEAAAKAEEAARAKNSKNSKNSKSSKSSSSSKSSGSSSSSGGSNYSASGSGSGSAVANYALQFVGNPYVYGGSSLTNGTDCSGFVMSVYRKFGISLPHSSGADRSVGYAVSGGLANAQAGDIVCYSGHVGIYIGGGQIVHASTAKTGIKVSSANYRSAVAVRRIF